MKNGFTLMELLTVIIVLGVIGLIIFPIANVTIKEMRNKLYNDQINEIKLASRDWAYDNIDLVPNVEGQSITITVQELKHGGYLQPDIRDPRTNHPISNELSIIITYRNNDYEFEINEIADSTEYTENSPTLILNGQPLETVEINDKYVEKGIVAKDVDGNIINNVTITYYDNESEITSIDTSNLKTYTVEYKATDSSNLTSKIRKTVIINDTIAPTIEVPNKITISSIEAENYDLMKDVYISDNSNKKTTIDITGFDSTVGEKIVSYKACDNSNNCNTKNRIIVVN